MRRFLPADAPRIGPGKCLLVACLAALLGCGPREASAPPTPANGRPPGEAAIPAPSLPLPASEIRFREVARSAGIDFAHHAPLTSKRHTHLVMGSGLGWLDYDRDGWPDLYCCQGAAFEADEASPAAPNAQRRDKLFRNFGGSFEEAALPAGIVNLGFSMGVAAADYDNDGFVDLAVTGYEENALYRNNGDGTFSRTPLPEQVRGGRLSASCAWGDIDGDGNLDLYITNYAHLDRDDYPVCDYTHAGKTIFIVCHPSLLRPLPDLLCRNLGDGGFADVSGEAGLTAASACHGLGVIAADLDQDGDIDFYVANDTTPNQLWENQGEGRFVERGAVSGVATNRHGAREAGMGVAVGDVDGNGELDLFVANYYNETNTLYRNEGALLFTDVTDELGLGGPSRLRLGFGASLADFDGDGWPDLFVANGHVHDQLHTIARDEPFAQPALLFHNQQGRRFADLSAVSGAWLAEPHVGRGAAVADFNRDGAPDLAVSCLNEPAALLQNEGVGAASWLRIELVGKQSNRDGVGAVVQAKLGERAILRCVHAGCSYLSCDEGGLLLGLGGAEQADEVAIHWPSGRREVWRRLEARRLHRLVEGAGQELSSP